MAWKSVVDYMAAHKMNSSYGNRAALAKKYGIHNYRGSAGQNVALLGYLQKGAPKSHSSKPVVKAAPKPKISSKDKAWYDAYGKTIVGGTANTKSYAHYQALQKKYGLHNYTTGSSALHNLSIKALGGDKVAQAYMKALNIKAQDAKHGLWNGYDPTKDKNKTLQHYYRVDNPNATYTKNFDNSRYNAYVDMIMNNKQMTDDQMSNYNRIVNKYNLKDMTDPYNQSIYKADQDRKTQLQSQDIALNQSLAQSDAQNFQAMQQQQQDMASRGITDSGIAAGAYQQSIAQNNQNLSAAYAQAAQTKADINKSFDDQIAGYKADQQQAKAEQEAAAAKAQTDLMNAQTNQDKYLTASTGYVYMNGRMMTYKGKPMTSLEYQKLSETERHNVATENNIASKNAQDYALGVAKDKTAQQKIAADLQMAISKNKLDYAKLDYNYASLDAKNKYNQAQLKILAANAQSKKDGQQLTALGKQASSLSSQIVAYQKKGKKPPKSLVDKYNDTNNKISKLVGGIDFSDGGKGGDVNYSKSYNGNPTSFGGYRRYGSQPKSFNSHMSAAISKGVPFSWAKQLTELVGRESSFNPNAQNPTSTAHGYAQFLNSTVANYKKRYPSLNYSNPVDQLVLMYHYVKDRYGTPEKALIAWENRSPHWY